MASFHSSDPSSKRFTLETCIEKRPFDATVHAYTSLPRSTFLFSLVRSKTFSHRSFCGLLQASYPTPDTGIDSNLPLSSVLAMRIAALSD